MQEPLSTTLLLESENKYPDCLWMQLEGIPVPSGSTNTAQLDLHLTMQFNEQWQPLLGGRIKFGIKGGELRLKLENGEIFSEPSDFISSFCQVKITNSQDNLAGIFEAGKGEAFLKGLFNNLKLGTVKVTGNSCCIEAKFAVSKLDVNVTDAEGLWRHDISPNKHAVLERKLVLFLWEAKLKPYLSWAQLCYKCSPSPSPGEELSEAMASQIIQQLKDSIQQISEAKTNDFWELTKIANLDPMIDFAGGNLRGTTLSGVELSGANLCRSNLRGADLTDADLSEANLSSSILGGADLSGAFLEDADLNHADLHRASLALANLGGANLNGANLIEANLSNVNLSGAHVKEARFGKNPGLSEEVKLNLIQRGAIFEQL